MNCYLHPEAPAVAYCRACGRPLCAVCQRPSEGTVFCQEHVPVANYPNAGGPQSSANPYFQSAPNAFAAPVSTSPGLAFLLGWIPGVGAIYNGQYLKGLMHAIVFGLLVTLISSVGRSEMEPLFGVILAAFVFYMPFEAFHTAKKRQQGVAVDEWSSLVAPSRYRSRAPVGPILLILLGVLFLLDTLRIIEFRELARFWPVLLIVMGAFMLYNRVAAPVAPAEPPAGPPVDRQAGGTGNVPASDFVEPRREQ